MYATNIATAIKMRPQAVSNQLQQLLSTNVLKCERKGNHLLYSIKDPCMVNLLEQALCMNQDICPRNI
jgi:DNA-binding transcriptional ArsR family regulator